MHLRSCFLFVALALRVTAQKFEPDDFNVTQALVDRGVNVTAIPGLSSLAGQSSNQACSIACNALQMVYGANYVINQSQAAYDTFTSGYWSLNQANVNPYCIFKPSTVSAVSVLVLLSRLTQCPFAVKSGGHAAFAGASNIDGGITVSFELLNGITLSKNLNTASVQAGQRWGNVYRELAKYDITVIGGRVSEVGVGGLTLGGGISFFSNRYGWACDNVDSYDVVTASGALITASAKDYPDLYWALRGGGNNFGLVVNFNYATISLEGNNMWGGTRTFLESSFPQVVSAFSKVVADAEKDKRAGQWVAWLSYGGTKLAAAELWYDRPNGNKSNIFSNYYTIPAVADTTQNRKFYGYTDEVQSNNPYGLREIYYGLTVKADNDLASLAKDIFFDEIPSVANVAGVNPVLLYQGITVPQLQKMKQNGGNPLGLDASDGPFYLIHVACWWQNEADDAKVYQMVSRVLKRIKEEAESRGKQNDYIYMNYASMFQHPVQSYGATNQAQLKSIANKYDPKKVFQTLQPGHFKLDRAPVPNSEFSLE
ncbi:MAG: hypothetical protein Q9198_002184 [Flavoplaca austrocitrina]